MSNVPHDLPYDDRLLRMRKKVTRIAKSCCCYK